MASGLDPLASSFSNVAPAGTDFAEPFVGSGLSKPDLQTDISAATTFAEARFSNTIRVLHVVNGEHFAGAERVQSHLGRCLPKYGVRADFACVKPGRFADAVDAAESKWGVAHRTAMQNRFDLSVVRRLAQTARSGGYDLLHAHTPRTAMLTAIVARMTKLPWVYHVHSPAARDSSKRMVNSINAWIERRSLRGCDHLITVSESLRNDCILAGYHPTRVTVVHNGVPAICYDRSETPKPGGRWVLGMVALMRPRKGLEVAIDAISRLRAVDHDVVLRCIGPFETEEYQREINRQISQLNLGDRVEQVGFQTDVPLALSNLDAMLLPSLYGEGLPMVVLEAMAAGLPVVATAVEGTPEAIRNGIDGVLAEPASATDLAFQIERLLTGKVDWHACAKSARERHGESFSDWAMSRGVASVYRQVIESHQNG